MNIEETVVNIVAKQMSVDNEQFSRDTHFVNDLGADSLDLIEIVMQLEDEFDLSIADEEVEKIQTVGRAIDYIVKAKDGPRLEAPEPSLFQATPPSDE